MIKRKSKNEFKVTIPCGDKPVTGKDINDMRLWCFQTFGNGGRAPDRKWRYGWVDRTYDSFYFRHERDALLFVLRWA